MRTLKNVAVQHGGSVTIPCLYEEKYRANRKYWCKGYYWAYCSIVAYANANGSTSVIDHPALNMFTVGLKHVSESETYWCGAEIAVAGDDGDYLQLTLSQGKKKPNRGKKYKIYNRIAYKNRFAASLF